MARDGSPSSPAERGTRRRLARDSSASSLHMHAIKKSLEAKKPTELEQTVEHLQNLLLAEQQECMLAMDRAKLLERKVSSLERQLQTETLRCKELEGALSEARVRMSHHTHTMVHHDWKSSSSASEMKESFPSPSCSQRDSVGIRATEGRESGNGLGDLKLSEGTHEDWERGDLGNGGGREEEGKKREVSRFLGNPSSSSWEEVSGLLLEKRDSRSMLERRLSSLWQQMGEEMTNLAEVRGAEEQILHELMAWIGHLTALKNQSQKDVKQEEDPKKGNLLCNKPEGSFVEETFTAGSGTERRRYENQGDDSADDCKENLQEPSAPPQNRASSSDHSLSLSAGLAGHSGSPHRSFGDSRRKSGSRSDKKQSEGGFQGLTRGSRQNSLEKKVRGKPPGLPPVKTSVSTGVKLQVATSQSSHGKQNDNESDEERSVNFPGVEGKSNAPHNPEQSQQPLEGIASGEESVKLFQYSEEGFQSAGFDLSHSGRLEGDGEERVSSDPRSSGVPPDPQKESSLKKPPSKTSSVGSQNNTIHSSSHLRGPSEEQILAVVQSGEGRQEKLSTLLQQINAVKGEIRSELSKQGRQSVGGRNLTIDLHVGPRHEYSKQGWSGTRSQFQQNPGSAGNEPGFGSYEVRREPEVFGAALPAYSFLPPPHFNSSAMDHGARLESHPSLEGFNMFKLTEINSPDSFNYFASQEGNLSPLVQFPSSSRSSMAQKDNEFPTTFFESEGRMPARTLSGLSTSSRHRGMSDFNMERMYVSGEFSQPKKK